MKKLSKSVFLFHSLNICLSVILNNIYDWQGKYFMLGLVTYLFPNIIGLILNYICGGILGKLIYENNVKKFMLPLIFFLVNELSYIITEKHIMFFGLFQSLPQANTIPVDTTSYILISLSSAISAIVVFFRLVKVVGIKKYK